MIKIFISHVYHSTSNIYALTNNSMLDENMDRCKDEQPPGDVILIYKNSYVTHANPLGGLFERFKI